MAVVEQEKGATSLGPIAGLASAIAMGVVIGLLNYLPFLQYILSISIDIQ